MRKLAALHREMSHLRDGKVYFLSYRDAAKVYDELNPSSAHTITLALNGFGIIKIVSKGKAGLNSRKAAEFRYLLPETEKRAEGNNGCHASKDAEAETAEDYPF